MKNIIKTLALSSVLLSSSFSFANDNNVNLSLDGSKIEKDKGFKVKTISYDEQYSVEKWHKDLKEMFQYEYEPYAKNVIRKFPEVDYGTKEYGSIINYTKAQMLNKFWHQINTDFKDSNNAKVAFCKYTEDLDVISHTLRVCDKNYDFHNQKNVRVNLVSYDVIPAPEPPVSNKNKKPM